MKLAISETIRTSHIYSSFRTSVTPSVRLARREMRFAARYATSARDLLGHRRVSKAADLGAQLVCVVFILKIVAVANLHLRSNLLEHIMAVAEVNPRNALLHVVSHSHLLILLVIRCSRHGPRETCSAGRLRGEGNPKPQKHLQTSHRARAGLLAVGGTNQASNKLLPDISLCPRPCPCVPESA